MSRFRLSTLPATVFAEKGDPRLIIDSEHFRAIVQDGILKAKTSVDVMTADFKALLVPVGASRRA
jgi:hypothetical protein